MHSHTDNRNIIRYKTELSRTVGQFRHTLTQSQILRVAPHAPAQQHTTQLTGLNTQHTARETPLTVCMYMSEGESMPRTGHMRRAAEATHTLPHRPPRLGHLALAAGRSRRPFLARPRSLLGTGSGRGVCRLVREWRSATKVAHASGLTRCRNPIADTYPVSIFVCCDDSQPGAVFESMCTRTTSTPCRRERGVSGTGLEDLSSQRRRRRRLLAQLLRRVESELDLQSACARHARKDTSRSSSFVKLTSRSSRVCSTGTVCSDSSRRA